MDLRKESNARFLGNLQISRPSVPINFQSLKEESIKFLRMDTEMQIFAFFVISFEQFRESPGWADSMTFH